VEVEDKVALVTGGASGIGYAVARALTERGASVAIVDVDEQGGKPAAAALDAQFIAADVSDLGECLHAVEQVSERFGGLHLVHLNAGVSTGCGIGEDFDLDAYRRAMGVNLDGVVFGVHAVLPALRANGGGAIVATASLAGLTGMPFDPIYTANKHAVVGLVRSLGPALVKDRVRVNAVCPGFTESKIIEPIREALVAEGLPIIPAEQVAEAVIGLFESDVSGECEFVQAGRRSEPFRFRGIPGPRPAA
jgi:NAD(P)-dependent dehydrogenase (short-subunit alcohol dehydrogenase family)